MSKERAAQLIDAGLWLKLSGDREGSQKLFERALKLDPANEQAKNLISGSAPDAQPAVPAVPASRNSGISNPFARTEADSSPAAVEVDWGSATGFSSPAPFSPPMIAPTAGLSRQSPVPHLSSPVSSSSSEEEIVFNETASGVVGPASQSEEVEVWGSDAGPEGPAGHVFAPVVAEPTMMTVVIGGAADPSAGLVPVTPPIFSNSSIASTSASERSVSPSSPRDYDAKTGNVSITGTPVPQTSPLISPPMAGFGDPGTIRLSGDAGPNESPRPTPPLFEGSLPSQGDAAGFSKSSDSAWNWSGPHASSAKATSPTPPIQGFAAPWPQPPPAAAPAAITTAWEAKSNPGVTLGPVQGAGGALELVGPIGTPPVSSPSQTGARVASEVQSLLRGARDLLDLDDHSGAVELIMKAQSLAPGNEEVQSLRDRSERTLLTMFESKLGKMTAVPRVLLKDDEIIWLNLDHRAGFVLAQIDGSVSFDDVFAVSGMSRLDTARIIAQLIDEGVISRG